MTGGLTMASSPSGSDLVSPQCPLLRECPRDYDVVHSIERHAHDLAKSLRKADAAEIQAIRGLAPLEALLECLAKSDCCFTALVNGEPLAMFGTVPSERDTAQVWMLGSDSITRHRRWFLREARYWLPILQEPYKVLWNHLDARNLVHLRWVRWLGFSTAGPSPHFGHESRPFYYIELNHSSMPREKRRRSSLLLPCHGTIEPC